MRILYFTRAQSPHDLRFLTALAQSVHQVAVLCLEGGEQPEWPENVQELAWAGGLAKVSWWQTPRLVRSLQQVVKTYQPEVIHAGPIQRVAFIAALAGLRPLVSMSWGSDLLREADQNLWWRWVTRFTLRHTTILAADCQTVVDKARKFGFNGSARIFPWGVDLLHFKPNRVGELRKKLGWQKNIVFLSNRTMEELYGVEVVAAAFIQASLLNANLRLLLFGKGSQEEEIRALLQDAGVSHKAYFGGVASLEELPDIYNSADFYVSASHSDGSSVSLMEALACGKPVIVSDIPSNREWITPGEQGWLFQDGNADDLAQKMQDASQTKGIIEIARNCRILAEKRADWKENFKILLDTYKEAIRISDKEFTI
jgi:L-malate glycosyltransferase